MSVTDDLLRNNEAYAETFDKGDLPLPPAKKVAVVACMDARLDVHGLLGLQLGDAHVIRNAGGVVTDDEIRSLAISQRLLGTEEIVLIHHTDCGMLTFTDDSFRGDLQKDTGIKPTWSPESFTDLDADVRSSIGRIKAQPVHPERDSVRGFVYDVHTGKPARGQPAAEPGERAPQALGQRRLRPPAQAGGRGGRVEDRAADLAQAGRVPVIVSRPERRGQFHAGSSRRPVETLIAPCSSERPAAANARTTSST